MPPLSIETFDSKKHHRAAFDCGNEDLNQYLRTKLTQDLKRNACGCWVLIDPAHPGRILGFYTLSSEGILLSDLPEDFRKKHRKKLPTYPRLGACLLGRMATDREFQNQGLGAKMLIDAFWRVLNAEIPSVLMVIDPKNDRARAFYEKFYFARLTENRLVITLDQIARFLTDPD